MEPTPVPPWRYRWRALEVACVEPVLVEGCKLFMLVHSFRNFQLPRLFEKGCKTSEELLLVYVFSTNSWHRAGERPLNVLE
jgi:hypothetical protein